MIASQEGTLEVVQALLNEGALPNATTIRGSTPLIQACHFGKFSVVEELLRHGALVDQANLKNTTALMRASQEGHEVCVLLALHSVALSLFIMRTHFEVTNLVSLLQYLDSLFSSRIRM